MAFLVEDSKEGQKGYDSLVISNPRHLAALSSELAQKILKVLSENPSSAMDVARKLKEHEQKIYYHFRNLERINVIKVIKTEKVVGAFAKIYAISYPAVSVKLYEPQSTIDRKTKIRELKFFHPFIDKGKLNATIVVGSPDPHGKFAAQASDGYGAIDLALFLGSLTSESIVPNYKLDTEMEDADLKKNLILVGGPKANIIVEKFNKELPVYFDFHREWNIVSQLSKNVYNEDDVGLIAKIRNPFAKNKEILIISGKRFKGTKAAALAIFKYLKEIEKGNRYDPTVIARVVQGVDRDSDGKIDDVKFLE
jgi:hypothetical protein